MPSLLGICMGCTRAEYVDADVADFAQLAEDSSVVLIDVRTPEEFAEGHLPGARNIDVKQDGFADQVWREVADIIGENRQLAVYCRSGRRSAHAAHLLGQAKRGYRVTNLKGGIEAWKQQNMPVTQDQH